MDKAKRNNSKLVPIVTMCVLAVGNIALAGSGILNFSAGTPVDISGLDTGTYGVESVRLLSDGSYLVNSIADGFQSDIEVAVSFSADGQTIQSVAVISQDETSGLGTKVAEDSFLAQFTEVMAPVAMAGKGMVVASPNGGSAVAVVEVDEEEAVVVVANQYLWDATDDSPENIAMKALYDAGLLDSAYQGEALAVAPADYSPEDKAMYEMFQSGLVTTDEFAPAGHVDDSPEGEAMRALYAAGLLDSAYQGTELKVPVAASDVSEAVSVSSVSATELDAVSGATVSSVAVATAVDNAYFFLMENVID